MGTTVLNNSIRWKPNRHKFCKLLEKAMTNKTVASGVRQGESSMHTRHLYISPCKGTILNYLTTRLATFVVDTTSKEFWGNDDQ